MDERKKGNALAELARTGHRGAEVRAMMREKCTEKSRHSMPGNRRKKTAEYRGKQNKPTYRPGNRTRQTAEYRGEQNKIITIKRKEKRKWQRSQ